jgi:hypothetical protein
MRTRTRCGLALSLCLAALPVASAQAPPIPAAPAAPAALPPLPGAPPVVAPAAAPPNNLWSFLFPSPTQCATLKAHFCASPFGQIASAMGQPMSMMSGGLFGGCCPANGLNPNDLLKDPGSSEGAAALVKADEAGAAARRAAIRYLSTVDCRYWPEAEAALINGLRADKIECVRWEAAKALQRGCCCTTKIILALTICVAGAETDGFPAECSARVRDNAAIALSMCVADSPAPYLLAPPVPTITPEKIQGPEKVIPNEKLGPPIPVSAKELEKRARDARRAQVVEEARRVLSEYYHRPIAQISPGAPPPPQNRPGANGLFGLAADAIGGTGETSAPPTAEPQRTGLVYLAYQRMHTGSATSTAPTGPVVTVQVSPYNTIVPAAANPAPGPRVTTGYVEWDR